MEYEKVELTTTESGMLVTRSWWWTGGKVAIGKMLIKGYKISVRLIWPFISPFSAEYQTQYFTNDGQAPYHWTTSPALKISVIWEK